MITLCASAGNGPTDNNSAAPSATPTTFTIFASPRLSRPAEPRPTRARSASRAGLRPETRRRRSAAARRQPLTGLGAPRTPDRAAPRTVTEIPVGRAAPARRAAVPGLLVVAAAGVVRLDLREDV